MHSFSKFFLLVFSTELERNAFVQALARFTLLTDNANVAEIKNKNVESIKVTREIEYVERGCWKLLSILQNEAQKNLQLKIQVELFNFEFELLTM